MTEQTIDEKIEILKNNAVLLLAHSVDGLTKERAIKIVDSILSASLLSVASVMKESSKS